MGQSSTKSTIPEPFWCDHSHEIKEVYRNDSSYPNYFKCVVCGDEFPVIGDTNQWKPVLVDYDKLS